MFGRATKLTTSLLIVAVLSQSAAAEAPISNGTVGSFEVRSLVFGSVGLVGLGGRA